MSMKLEKAIEHAEDTAMSAIGCECREEHRQLAEWLKELKERRKQPDIIRCKDCRWWDKHNEMYGYCLAAKHGHWSEHWE